MLPKKLRLSRLQLLNLKSQSHRLTSQNFTIYCRSNSLSYSRFAVTVSLQVSKLAVRRNLIKRQIFTLSHIFPPGWDILIVASPTIIKLNYDQISLAFNSFVSEAPLFTTRTV